MIKTILPLTGILAATLSGCTPQSSFDEAAKTNSSAITVTRVKDGDTFEIAAPWSPFPKLEWSVRVLGIDTPEKGYLAKCQREKDRAQQASALARDLMAKSGNEVTLSRVKHDKYGGRFDADVTLKDGTSYAKAMLDAGLAKQYNGNGPKPKWCF